MSVWTHVLGVIRFDSFAKNTYPEPHNKEEFLDYELMNLNDIFKRNVPFGSEGPIEINFVQTNRGPVMLLTADLRDFDKENVKEILNWLNDGIKELFERQKRADSFYFKMFMVRDCNIRCDVEFEKEYFYIVFNWERLEFEFLKVPKREDIC